MKYYKLARIHETDMSGQIITTSAEVTLNGGLVRELPQNPLNSGLGIIVICPDMYMYLLIDHEKNQPIHGSVN